MKPSIKRALVRDRVSTALEMLRRSRASAQDLYAQAASSDIGSVVGYAYLDAAIGYVASDLEKALAEMPS